MKLQLPFSLAAAAAVCLGLARPAVAAPAPSLPGSFGRDRSPGLMPVRWHPADGRHDDQVARAGDPPASQPSTEPGTASRPAQSQPAATRPASGAAPASQPAADDEGHAERARPSTRPAEGKRDTSDEQSGAKPKEQRAAGSVPIGGSCRSDEQCAAGSYCDEQSNVCRKVERPLNIAYLFYRSGDGRMMQIMGVYWHRRGVHGYRVVFPLYWHFWNKRRHHQVIFPLFWRFDTARTRNIVVPPFQYRRTPTERNYRLWPLVFWTDYGKRGAGLTVLPLFHHSREGTKRTTVLPILASFFQSDTATKSSRGLIGGIFYWSRKDDPEKPDHERALALFPLFYHSRSQHRAFTWALPLNFYWRRRNERGLVIFPLAYHRRQGDRSLTIAGPVFHRRRGDTAYGGVVPLAFWYSSADSTTAAGFPLFVYRSTRKGRYASLVSPLFLYERDRDAKITQWGLTVPPYYHRSDDERDVDALIPLFLRWHNKVEKTTTYLAGPVYLRSDPDGRTQIAFPLFWRFEDARSGASTSVLFPLAYRHRRPDGSHFSMLFPFYFKRSTDRWSAGMLPLLYFGAGAGKRHAVLFPLLWHFSSPRRSTTIVGPAYFDRDPKGWRAGLAPLLFFGNRAGESHHVVFPLYWHLASREHGYDTHVAGPAFYSSGRKGTMFGLVPLFAAGHWKGDRFVAVLPPLFYRSYDRHGHGFTLAGLYFGYREAHAKGHYVLPLFFYRRSWNKRGTTTSTTVVPLFHYRSSPRGQLLVTPVGGLRRDKEKHIDQGIFGPYAWHRSDDLRGFAVLPAFFRYTKPKEKRTTTVVLPLFVRSVTPNSSAHVLFPFYWRFTGPKESSLVVFPFYWRQRSKKGENFDVAFPLVWRLRNQKRTLTVIGNVFWRRSKTSRTWGVLPLMGYHKNEKRSYFAALPFFYHQHTFKPHRRLLIAGPAYYHRYDKGYRAGFAPLFFHQRASDRDYTIGIPLYWHFRDPQAKTSWTWVGPFYYRKKPEYRALGVVPLFHTSVDRGGGRTVAVAPLFYYRREVARRALYTPLFGFDKTPERTRWYVPPYFHETGVKRSINVLAPLFFRYRNHEQGRTTVFALPGYFGRWDRGSSVHIVFPLFWRRRTVDSTQTVAFPFYWDFHDRHATRTTIIFPLMMHRRNEREDSSAYLFPPGVWVRRRKKTTDAVVFPLLWHFGGERSSTTIGFPLYWDFKRPGSRTTLAVPFFLRLDRKHYRTWFVLNSYYRRDKDRGTYNFHFFPLVHVQRKRPRDLLVDVLGGLFGYERIGRNRVLTILFFPIKLAPAKPATKGAPKPNKGGPKPKKAAAVGPP